MPYRIHLWVLFHKLVGKNPLGFSLQELDAQGSVNATSEDRIRRDNPPKDQLYTDIAYMKSHQWKLYVYKALFNQT